MKDVKRNPYTQKAIERAIKAVLKCGLKVVAVQPDGTVYTEPGDAPAILKLTPRPRDAREKHGDFARNEALYLEAERLLGKPLQRPGARRKKLDDFAPIDVVAEDL
jgi:hypothetical protein